MNERGKQQEVGKSREWEGGKARRRMGSRKRWLTCCIGVGGNRQEARVMLVK